MGNDDSLRRRVAEVTADLQAHLFVAEEVRREGKTSRLEER